MPISKSLLGLAMWILAHSGLHSMTPVYLSIFKIDLESTCVVPGRGGICSFSLYCGCNMIHDTFILWILIFPVFRAPFHICDTTPFEQQNKIICHPQT